MIDEEKEHACEACGAMAYKDESGVWWFNCYCCEGCGTECGCCCYCEEEDSEEKE